MKRILLLLFLLLLVRGVSANTDYGCCCNEEIFDANNFVISYSTTLADDCVSPNTFVSITNGYDPTTGYNNLGIPVDIETTCTTLCEAELNTCVGDTCGNTTQDTNGTENICDPQTDEDCDGIPNDYDPDYTGGTGDTGNDTGGVAHYTLTGNLYNLTDENNASLNEGIIYLNILNSNTVAITDSNGYFSLANLPEQNNLILYSTHSECKTDIKTINNFDSDTHVNIGLDCSPLVCEDTLDVHNIETGIFGNYELRIFPDSDNTNTIISNNCDSHITKIIIKVNNDNNNVFLTYDNPENISALINQNNFLSVNLLNPQLGFDNDLGILSAGSNPSFSFGIVYDDGITYYGAPMSFSLGDPICWIKNDYFCQEEDGINSLFDCNSELNKVKEGCETNQFCYDDGNTAVCKDPEPCESCNSINSMFPYIFSINDTENSDTLSCKELIETPGTCFLESTFTIQDLYKSCEDASSCYDYTTEYSCNEKLCGDFNTGCTWTLSEPNILGRGLCVPNNQEFDCTACTDTYGDDCDQTMCEGFSDDISNCVYAERGGENICITKDWFSCKDYDNEYDCIGGISFDLNVQYLPNNEDRTGNTNDIIQESDDIQGLGICIWKDNSCQRDADGNGNVYHQDCGDDTDQVTDLVCEADRSVPETFIALSSNQLLDESDIIKSDEELYYVVDTGFSGVDATTYFCIDQNGVCYPEMEDNSLHELFNDEATFTNEGTYTIKYYSEDNSKNLEEIKSLNVYYPGNENIDLPSITSISLNSQTSGIINSFSMEENNFTLYVTFSEPVDITRNNGIIVSSVKLDSNNTDYYSTFTTADNINYVFTSPNNIENNNYTLRFYFKKYDESIAQVNYYDVSFDIHKPIFIPPYFFNITLVNPESGFNNAQPPFNIFFTTDKDAVCKFAYSDEFVNYSDMITFDSSTQTQITDISLNHNLSYHLNNIEKDFYIGCKNIHNGKEIYAYKHFLFGWDEGKPTINSIVQDPQPMTDNSDMYSDLIITTDQKTFCQASHYATDTHLYTSPLSSEFIQQKTNFSNYKTTNTLTICFEESCEGLHIPEAYSIRDTKLYNYSIYVSCLNRPWNNSNQFFDVTIKLTNDPRLTQVRPLEFESVQPVILNLKSDTSVNDCSYKIDGGAFKFYTKQTNRNFSASQTIGDGIHTINSSCTNTNLAEDLVISKTFTVDSIAPTFAINLPDSVCVDKKLSFNWTAQDTVSGVDKLSYWMKDSEGIIVGKGVTKLNKSLSFDVLSGDYTFIASVSDIAGNIADNLTKTVTYHNDSEIICDFTAPTIKVLQNRSNHTTDYHVTCVDNNACTTSFSYDIFVGSDADHINCSFNTTGSYDHIYTADKTSILCLKGEDSAGNIKINKEKINVGFPDDTNNSNGTGICYDGIKNFGETDIDCGSSCPTCELNKSCEADIDCESDYCNSDNLCEVSTEKVECYHDYECEAKMSGMTCNEKHKCVLESPQDNSPSSNTDDFVDPTTQEDNNGINILSIILLVLGIGLLGGGGFFYFTAKPIIKPLASTPMKSLASTKTNTPIQEKKTLDYNDTKKVNKLRERLSKNKPDKVRKSLLKTFNKVDSVDKEMPIGTEKSDKELLPKIVKKKIKSVSTIKSIDKKASEKIDEEPKFIPINKINNKNDVKDDNLKEKKKKDLFDELENL